MMYMDKPFPNFSIYFLKIHPAYCTLASMHFYTFFTGNNIALIFINDDFLSRSFP